MAVTAAAAALWRQQLLEWERRSPGCGCSCTTWPHKVRFQAGSKLLDLPHIVPAALLVHCHFARGLHVLFLPRRRRTNLRSKEIHIAYVVSPSTLHIVSDEVGHVLGDEANGRGRGRRGCCLSMLCGKRSHVGAGRLRHIVAVVDPQYGTMVVHGTTSLKRERKNRKN